MAWWTDFGLDIQIIVQPRILPCFVFIDDTLRHFSNSHKILGLLAPSSEKTPLDRPILSRRARKVWNKYAINETYDSKAGIPASALYRLANVISKNKNDVRGIILDWDKTISVHTSFRSEVINKHVMECYFGGFKRMKALCYFFKKMKKNNIHIQILTNNGRARRDSEAFTKGLSYVKGSWINVQFTDATCKSNLINKI